MTLYTLLGMFFFNIERLKNYYIKNYQKSLFKKCGKNVYIGNGCTFTNHTITIGNNVSIGSNCVFQSAHGNINIGNNIMFGPGVHIHGGNHIFNKIGVYMINNNDKKIDEDGNIIICDDVWIGSNAIILKGVNIGQGSIIGAGSVVTKNVEPFSIVGGNPAKLIKMRFNQEEIKKHKDILNI